MINKEMEVKECIYIITNQFARYLLLLRKGIQKKEFEKRSFHNDISSMSEKNAENWYRVIINISMDDVKN